MKKQRKTQQKMNIIDWLYDAVQKCLQLLCSIYMFLILVVMPFYFTDGYARIGTNKYQFFEAATERVGIVFQVIFFLWAILRLVRKEQWRRPALSLLDIAVGVYGICVLISYLLSAYQVETPYGDVWNGANGWYMGAKTQLSFVGIYFAVSRFWSGKRWMIYSVMPVSFVVFVLGILNRFSVYPVEMRAASPSFISTIGNMNWYCGYAVIIFFAMAGYFWMMEEHVSFWWIAYLLVGFGTLLTQGSVSGLVTLFVVVFVLYLLSGKNEKRMDRFWLLVMLLGMTMTVIYAVRRAFPDAMNFTDGIIDLFTDSPLTMAVLLLGIVMFCAMRWASKDGKVEKYIGIHRYLGRIMEGVLLVGGISYIVLLITNTLHPGVVGSLSENPLFVFDGSYGSGRGASWMAACKALAEQDILHKLFGVGPDGMAMYLYTDASEGLMTMLRDIFGEAILTNAHCEVLNVLVNIGIFGAAAFVAVFVCVFCILRREMRQGEKGSVLAVALSLGVMAYVINNLFSFQQAMNGATIYVVLGLLGALERKRCVPITKNM